MKKLFTLFVFSGLMMIAFSQSMSSRCMPEGEKPVSSPENIDIVGDFTITDSQGNTWNLYQQLNLGNTVIIDLFFTT